MRISNTEDYFEVMSKITDPDKFTLRGLCRSFNELYKNNQPGGLINVLKVNQQN